MTSVSMRGCASAVFAAVAMAAVSLATPVVAQQSVKITFVSGYPPSTTFVGAFVDHYMKEVDATLAKGGKYKLDWNIAHSGQIAKTRGEMEAVQSGIADIAIIPVPAHFDRVPLYQVPYATPFTSDDVAYLVETLTAVEKKFPQYEASWNAVNMRSISLTANVDNYVLLTKAPITKVVDLKGMKIGAVGANMHYVTAVGATGVTALATDWFPGLNSGLYEGIIGWAQVIASFKLCEPAKYMLNSRIGASSPITLGVNLDVLKKMPEEIRNALTAAAPTWNKAQIDLLMAGTTSGLEACKKEGMKVIEMSDAEVAAWAKSLPPLGLDWAKAQDAKGLPGTGVLSAYMDNMRAGKQRVVRNWDKE